MFVDAIHFCYEGGQVRSMLSFLSYLVSGEIRPRYLGIKIPPTNIQEYHLAEARTFANGLADRLLGPTRRPGAPVEADERPPPRPGRSTEESHLSNDG